MDNESTLMEQYFNEAEYLAARERVDALSDTPLVDGDAYADYMVNGVAYNINPSNAFDESDFFQAFIDAAAEDDATWEMISVEDLMTFLNENYPGTSGLGYYMNAPELFEEWGVSPVAVAGDEMVEVETSYTISQSATMVAEGDALVITITGSQAADDDVTFAYELSSTEAGASDFASSTSGSVTIPAGETSATITVDIAANDGAEFAEDFSVVISSGGAEVTTINATITDTSSVVPPVVDADQSYTFDENQADEAAVLATVTATDADEDAVAGFEIVGGNDDGFFTINDAGEIMFTEAGLASALNDFEATPDPAVLEIVAIDADGNTSEAVAVTLTVADVDDVAPELSMSTIGMASATLTFSELLDESSVPSPSDFLVTIQGQSTTIGVNTVTVDGNQVILALGQEPADGQTFLVDYTPGTNPLMDMSGMAAVGFDDAELVEDASAPVIEAGQTFSYQEESLAAGDALGDAVAASDDVGVATFEITGGNDDGFFAIDNDGVISLTAAGAAANVASNDFETTPNSFALEITATDAAGNIDVETVTVSVTNDEADDGESFVLTINTDAGAAYTGTDGDDVFYGEENTLTSNDDLDGAAGDADLLRYSSSGDFQVNEAGFTISNIERVQVTGDVTNAATMYETVFDVTNTNGVETLINDNSSTGVQFTGAQELFGLELNHVGGNSAGASHTRVDYQAGVVAGTADAQQVLLNDVRSDNGTAAGQLTVNGIETFNIVTEGESSQLTALNSNALQTVNISGDQDLTIDNLIANATTVNAGTFEGNLNIVVDSAGTARDVVVTGGSGDDRVDFSAGFESGDSLDGGEGDMDTIVLSNVNATTAPAGAIQNVEILEISTAGSGIVDMDDFPGVVNVDYVAGLGGGTTVDNAVSGITVEVNVDDPAAVAPANPFAPAQNLTVALKADATDDVVNFQFDNIGNLSVPVAPAVVVPDALATVTAANADTLNIQVNDDAAVAGTGALQIGTLSAQDAETINISGDADLNILAANNLLVSGLPASLLSTFNAADMSGDLTVAGTNFANGGANIVLGSGDDTLTFAIANGADTITLGAGADTVVYNAKAQSDRDMDTITDFVSGTDVVDVRTLMSTVPFVALDAQMDQFVGNRATFAQAQGALDTTNILPSAVFQQDEQILWVDIDNNGTLDNNDFRVHLDGVSAITTTDLGFTVGNDISLNAAGANVGLAVKTNATNFSTAEADTISSTATNLAGSTIDGFAGNDVLTVTGDPSNITSLIAAAGWNPNITNVETINFNDGTGVLNLGASIPGSLSNLNVTGGDLIATTTAAGQTFTLAGSGAGTLTFGGQANTTFNTAAGADVINAVTLASQTVSTGNGADTINVTADAGMGADIDAGAGVDILNWVVSGAAAARTMATIDGVETVNVTANAGNTLTVNDDVQTVNFLAAGDASGVTVNATSAEANGLIITDLDGGADVFNITTSGTFTLGALTGIETVNFAAGDNVVSTAAANVAGATTAFDGGVGDNTLTLTNAVVAADLNTVTDFDTINLGGAANTILAVDTLVAAGESVLIDASATTGLLLLNATAELDGVFHVNVGDNGSTVFMAANALADTITFGAGADNLQVDATSTVNNLSQMDTIVDFRASGNDKIDFSTDGVAQSGNVYTLSIANATLAGLAGAANTEIANQSIVAAAGDMFILEVAGGAAAGTYAAQDLTGNNITGDDLMVELSGVIGAIAPADFI